MMFINKKLIIAGGVLLIAVVASTLRGAGFWETIKGWLPESAEVVQTRHQQVLELQNDVKALMQRLQEERQEIADSLQTWQAKADELENRSGESAGPETERLRHLSRAHRKESFWRTVAALADSRVYNLPEYLQLQDEVNKAQQLIGVERTKAAKEILSVTRLTIITMLAQLEPLEQIVKVGELRKNWLILVDKNSWKLSGTVLEIENRFQKIEQQNTKSELAESNRGYKLLENEYRALISSGNKLIIAQRALERAKSSWHALALRCSLTDIQQGIELDSSYRKYGKNLARGFQAQLVDEVTMLEAGYGNILIEAEMACAEHTKALKARSKWGIYAKRVGMQPFIQSKQLNNQFIVAEDTLYSGDLAAASLSFKALVVGYDNLIGSVKVPVAARSKAQMVRKEYNGYIRRGHARQNDGELPSTIYKTATTVLSQGELAKATSLFNEATTLWKELNRRMKQLEQITLNMVTIPGGIYSMGDKNGYSMIEEKPLHTVKVGTFKLSKYEITQNQWEIVMGENPSHLGDCKNCPVDSVSWNDIQLFIKKLNRLVGRGFRLPSEAEWEYAARAGSSTKYSWGDEPSGKHANGSEMYGWPSDGYLDKPSPVGSFMANAFGLYDMSGNVWESTQDCWNSNYINAPAVGKPWLTGTCSKRVLRGGSWSLPPEYMRSSIRYGYDASGRNETGGFRLAQDLVK